MGLRLGLVRTIAVAGALAVGSGCVSVDPAAAVGRETTSIPVDELSRRFALGRGLMEGLDPVEPGGRWRAGDTALLGVAEDGNGPSKEWYLRIAVRPPPLIEWDGKTLAPSDSVTFRTSPRGEPRREVTAHFSLVPMKVEVFDGALNLVTETDAMMPEISLRYGLIEHVRQQREGVSMTDPAHNGPMIDGHVTASEVQLRGIAGLLALARFPQFVERVPSVEGLMARMVERPPLLSILANRGVSMSVQLAPREAVEVSPPPGVVGPVYRVPVRVEMNGRKALDCELLLATADPPFGACNGVLGLEAAHPRFVERRVRVRLLAARRGPAGSDEGESPVVAAR